jgi:hypothetical protein
MGTHKPCCFTPFSESFLIFLSILTLCVIALFTPFVLAGLFCDSDVTPSFQGRALERPGVGGSIPSLVTHFSQ